MATLKALKNECLIYAEKHFRGKSYINKSTGHRIEISKRGLNEWYAKSKSVAQILSIKYLDRILEEATYTHRAANTKNLEKNAPSYEYYAYQMELCGERYTAIVSVRVISVAKTSRFIYYHHYLDGIEIKKQPPSSMPRNPYSKSNELLLGGLKLS